MSVERVEHRHDGFVLVLKTSREAERDKLVDNLIIEAFGVTIVGSAADGTKHVTLGLAFKAHVQPSLAAGIPPSTANRPAIQLSSSGIVR